MKILLSVMFVVNLVCISYLHLFMDRIEWRTSGKKRSSWSGQCYQCYRIYARQNECRLECSFNAQIGNENHWNLRATIVSISAFVDEIHMEINMRMTNDH